ncbi:MAG: ABC transporter permease [Actinomycetota bacterium]|nr:ABC transporter permease [Actinomycetota bacterium]
MSRTFAPHPGAAPMHRMVRAQTSMETRLLLRNGEQLVLAVVIPLVVLVAGVYAAGSLELTDADPVQVLTPGVLALAVMSTSFTSLAIATGFERRYGVLKRLGSSPLPRSGLLAGKVLALFAVQLLQFVLIAAAAVAIGWRPSPGLTGVAGAVTCVLAGTAAFASLGLLLAGILRAEATLAAANLVYVVLLIAGAVIVPPSAYGQVGWALTLLPSGALGSGLRESLGAGHLPWLHLVVLIVWAALGGMLTARTFRWE